MVYLPVENVQRVGVQSKVACGTPPPAYFENKCTYKEFWPFL